MKRDDATLRTSILQSDEMVRANTIRVFTYLKELAQLRTKVIRDCLDYEDLIWFNDIPKEKGCYTLPGVQKLRNTMMCG